AAQGGLGRGEQWAGLSRGGTGKRSAAYPSDMPTSVDVTSSALYERLQHEVALFARRAEQTRLAGVGKARNSMDRAAYLLLNRLTTAPSDYHAAAGGTEPASPQR